MKIEEEINMIRKEMEIIVKLLSDIDGRTIHTNNLVEGIAKDKGIIG